MATDRPVAAALAYDGRRTSQGKRIGSRVSHLIVVMRSGRIWERFSDMPPGAWGIVAAPPGKPRKK